MPGTAARPSDRPRFGAHLRLGVAADAAYLFDERGVTALHGAAVAALAPLLDGRRRLADLADARPAGMLPGQVTGLVGQLVDAGLVTCAGPGADERSQAWWDGYDGPLAAPAATGPVGLVAIGEGVDPALVGSALEASGLPVVAASPDTGIAGGVLDVVVCGDYLDPRLAGIDAAHRESGRPWLLAHVDGARLWIGPVFRPGDTGCWHCLAHRLSAHRRPELVVQQVLGSGAPASLPPASLPAGRVMAAHLLAMEVAKWLGGLRHPGQRGVWVFDTRTMAGEHHELRIRPQCPACGDPGIVADRTRRPVVLAPAPRVAGGGGDRTVGPAEMLARHRHLISPVTGLVKQVVRDPFAPPFVHAFRSGANVSRQVRGMAALRRSLRAENGGKGLDALDAEVGALCEAVERHCGVWQGDELTERARFSSLDDRAVDPRSCMIFDERQYAGREAWNAHHSPFNHVPEPFDPDAEIDWTPLWSLTRRRQRLMPSAMLYYGAPHVRSMFADSNGCAAGSSLEDAVLQGALELVERDAVALWWYNRASAPGVDLAAFGDEQVLAQRAHHASIGRELWVLDVTSDLGVPVMVALSRRRVAAADGGERILVGFGAHLDPRTALRRAVSEVNQMLPMDLADPTASGDPDWIAWARTATLAGQAYLAPDPTCPARGAGDHPSSRGADIRADVETLVDRCAARGLEFLVLDQTRPDVGIPVVKVVVPGLRTFWARFGPGRLFDVPVRSGRQVAPTAYDELNPLPLFM